MADETDKNIEMWKIKRVCYSAVLSRLHNLGGILLMLCLFDTAYQRP